MTAPSLAKENKERAEIMIAEAQRREREQAATMHGFAMNEAAQPRGRFDGAEGKQLVVGSTPGPIYPQLPASSPWAGPDLVGQEPPLGFSVDELEPSTGLLPSLVEAQAGPTSDAPSSLMEGDEPRSVDVGPNETPTVGQPPSKGPNNAP
jgi:hypothetical protein